MSWRSYAKRLNGRRTFLKGLGLGGGGLLLSPMLSRLHAEAQGNPGPKRLVIVIEGNGFYGFRDWKRLPDAVEETALPSLSDGLPMVQSWQPWRDRVIGINGLANKQGVGKGAGHRAHYYATTCMPYTDGGGPGGPSIDAVLARALATDDTVFPVVRLGADEGRRGLVPFNCAPRRGQRVAMQFNPRAAWLELFAAGSANADERQAFEQQGQLLGSLNEYGRGALNRFRGDERWKLERYLYSIETFQRRQALLVSRAAQLMACAPDAPDSGAGTGANAAIQFNNAAGALICGLTNIVVLSVGPGLTTFADWGFGGRHSMGHGGGETEMRPGGVEGLIQTSNLIAGEAANMIAQLEAVPEGDGTMFDNTAVVFINDNGSEHHSKYDNFPLAMVGDLGGALRTGGRLLEYPNYQKPGSRGLAEFWRTIAYAMGASGQEVDEFAMGNEGRNEGTLSELT